MRVHFNVSGHDLAPSQRRMIEQHFRFFSSMSAPPPSR